MKPSNRVISLICLNVAPVVTTANHFEHPDGLTGLQLCLQRPSRVSFDIRACPCSPVHSHIGVHSWLRGNGDGTFEEYDF